MHAYSKSQKGMSSVTKDLVFNVPNDRSLQTQVFTHYKQLTAMPLTTSYNKWQNTHKTDTEHRTLTNWCLLTTNINHQNLKYRIYSRPTYKPTPIPAAENLTKICDSHISQYQTSATSDYLDLCVDNVWVSMSSQQLRQVSTWQFLLCC